MNGKNARILEIHFFFRSFHRHRRRHIYYLLNQRLYSISILLSAMLCYIILTIRRYCVCIFVQLCYLMK